MKKQFKRMFQKLLMLLLACLPSLILLISCQTGTGVEKMTIPKTDIEKSSQQDETKLNTQQPKEIILFCGNPGVGKSTLCNSIFQKAVFQSGLSIGSGMTINKQEYFYEGRLYIDTPGLDDVKLKEKAAEEIEKSLKQNNNYKIVFVATLEAGRIKPADLATINTICDFIRTDFEYGIIFNKVTKKVMGQIPQEGLTSYLSTLCKKPISMMTLLLDHSMEDVANVYFDAKIRGMIVDFISRLKANHVPCAKVGALDVQICKERLKQIQAGYEQEIGNLMAKLQESNEQINNLQLGKETYIKELEGSKERLELLENQYKQEIEALKQQGRQQKAVSRSEIVNVKNQLILLKGEYAKNREMLTEQLKRQEEENQRKIESMKVKNYAFNNQARITYYTSLDKTLTKNISSEFAKLINEMQVKFGDVKVGSLEETLMYQQEFKDYEIMLKEFEKCDCIDKGSIRECLGELEAAYRKTTEIKEQYEDQLQYRALIDAIMKEIKPLEVELNMLQEEEAGGDIIIAKAEGIKSKIESGIRKLEVFKTNQDKTKIIANLQETQCQTEELIKNEKQKKVLLTKYKAALQQLPQHIPEQQIQETILKQTGKTIEKYKLKIKPKKDLNMQNLKNLFSNDGNTVELQKLLDTVIIQVKILS